MGENTQIEWAHHTFNPWMGCTKVSDGCKHCYAETMMDKRFGKVKWGPQGVRVRTSGQYWWNPSKWNLKAKKEGHRKRVFVASLADVFEDKPDQRAEMDEWRDMLFHYPHLYRNLDWLFLTKRPENVMRMVTPIWLERGFPSNVWIGTSVENQETADMRIPELLKIPAAVRFLSVEPLLGPVDVESIEWPNLGGHRVDVLRKGYWNKAGYLGLGPSAGLGEPRGGFSNHSDMPGSIDWVIVGGESGPSARPMLAEWVTDIRDCCEEAGVPFFFKQWGEWFPVSQWEYTPELELPDDDYRGPDVMELECRHGIETMHRVGKKNTGRLLDGQEWNEVPVVQEVA